MGFRCCLGISERERYTAMGKNIEKILDSNGNYDVNNGYKHISGGNVSDALELISSQLWRIMQGEYRQSKRPSYQVVSHDRDFDFAEFEKSKLEKASFRKEEWICKRCNNQSFSAVGKVVDYQVPLKHTNKTEVEDNCVGMGKIDLLSQKGSEAYLLEVKVPDSTEEPLRAIMEVYTYWKQLGGDSCANFLNNSKLSGAVTLKKGIVIYECDKKGSIYQKLMKSKDKLSGLMATLGVECFIAKTASKEDFFITDIVECKL